MFMAGWNGIIRCLSAVNGEEIWTANISGGEIKCSPLIAGNEIICGGDDGLLRLLDSSSGAETWRLSLGSAIAGAELAPTGELVATATDGAVHCLRIDK